jgi:hypothetical protein
MAQRRNTTPVRATYGLLIRRSLVRAQVEEPDKAHQRWKARYRNVSGLFPFHDRCQFGDSLRCRPAVRWLAVPVHAEPSARPWP